MDPSEEPADAACDESGGEGISKLWRGIFVFGFFSLVALTTVGALMRVSSLESEVETRAIIKAAEPLCVALDAFAKQHGHPPASLQELVPEFIAQLPPLRPQDDPGFEYQTGKEAQWTLTIWGGGFQYTRNAIEEPWFISADHSENYPRDTWLPLE